MAKDPCRWSAHSVYPVDTCRLPRTAQIAAFPVSVLFTFAPKARSEYVMHLSGNVMYVTCVLLCTRFHLGQQNCDEAAVPPNAQHNPGNPTQCRSEK